MTSGLRAAADPQQLTGYTPALSYAPGETVDLHLSGGRALAVQLVRLAGPFDGGPAGAVAAGGGPAGTVAAGGGTAGAVAAGTVAAGGGTANSREAIEPVGPAVEVPAPGVQPLRTGSWATVTITEPASTSAALWLLPTHRRPVGQTVLIARRGGLTLRLSTDDQGRLRLRVTCEGGDRTGDGGTRLDESFGLTLARLRWQRLAVRVDHDGIRVEHELAGRLQSFELPWSGGIGTGPLTVWIGTPGTSDDAQDTTHGGFLDGKVDEIVVADRAVHPDPQQVDARLRTDDGEVVGRLERHPTRGVTGHAWRDQTDRWTAAPELYSAFHLHSDDLDDAGWPVAARIELPADLRSGVYAAQLDDGAQRDWLPFVVRGPAGERAARGCGPAPLTVLLPTFTYLAYANEAPFAPHVAVRADERDEYATRHGLTSLYSYHSDGSGVAYASLHRPLLNLRPDYRYWLTGYPHGLGADLALMAFLDRTGVPYEVVTDHDLHTDPQLLDGRRAVLTGSHPEYWSRPMMHALATWLADGGRLVYAGGNGLYALVATLPDAPHILEFRRRGAEVGLWAAAPGEATMAATGELGGLWRHHSPTPASLTGACYCAMGFGAGAGYRMLPAARDPRAAFLLDGLADDTVSGRSLIGARGRWFGAAAGYECDRADTEQGTPEHAIVLARSEPLSAAYEATDATGERSAELVFFETGSGGAVFSVGSIAWAGALDVDDAVTRITANAVRRFADPAPFGDPASSPTA